jgi:hypothetical protein
MERFLCAFAYRSRVIYSLSNLSNLDIVTAGRKWVLASKDKMLLEQFRDAILETVTWGRSCFRVAAAIDPTLGTPPNPSGSSSGSSSDSDAKKKGLNRGVTFNTIRAGSVSSGSPDAAASTLPVAWRTEAKVLGDSHRAWVIKYPDPILD